MRRPSWLPRASLVITVSTILVLAACGGGAQATPTPTAVPSASVAASDGASPSQAATGDPGLTAPAEVPAGTAFDIDWTGPNGTGDYVTLVAAGAIAWTNEPYFYTTIGSPGTLTAPIAPGDYVLWYVSGADDAILFRLDISVLPFEGDLLAEEEVPGGAKFEVAWNGPDGPGDYVTVVLVGADRWTNESYFYTTIGSPGSLLAPLKAGAYEIWYVPGSETAPSARRPITVTPYQASVDGPATADVGGDIEVEWTGPDGPGDYITIVPVGAAPDVFESYFYTTIGSPGTLKAPDQRGDYEVRYIWGTVRTILARFEIRVE